jgi:hypothetical protein
VVLGLHLAQESDHLFFEYIHGFVSGEARFGIFREKLDFVQVQDNKSNADHMTMWGFRARDNMSTAVREILDRIDQLPEADREVLERELAERAEAEWRREAANAQEEARRRGLDDAAIDQAIENLRYSRDEPK